MKMAPTSRNDIQSVYQVTLHWVIKQTHTHSMYEILYSRLIESLSH